MNNNKKLPKHLLTAASKLHLLINNAAFIRGSLVYLKNTCGKQNCKCAKGEKHISLYIRQSLKGKPKATLIPKDRWNDLQIMTENYKQILQLLESISAYHWEHLKDKT